MTDYYIDMSAAAENKILGLRTPMLTVSALDDPIMTAAGSPIDIVEDVEDLFILLTRYGLVMFCALLPLYVQLAYLKMSGFRV